MVLGPAANGVGLSWNCGV